MTKPLSSQIQPPGLYIVATPIGNLGDITLRALEILKNVDLIACEDTRVTGKLLHHFGIKTKMLSYNDHNGEDRRPHILQALAEKKRVALVSDAGTPLISDPGYKLVRTATEEGHYVTTLPGASSVMAALCIAGLPTDRFFFAGFLPAKQEACRKELDSVKTIPATLVFFESPKRLSTSLALMLQVLGNRQAAILRELTKLHEERHTALLETLAERYQEHEVKGEVVIVVAPPEKTALSNIDLTRELQTLLKTLSVKDAATLLARQTSQPRSEIYTLALRLKNESD